MYLAIWQLLFRLINRKLHRMGPHQAFFDEWGLEGPSWLFLTLPGSSWLLLEGPNPCKSKKNRNCHNMAIGHSAITWVAPSVDSDVQPAWSPDAMQLAWIRAARMRFLDFGADVPTISDDFPKIFRQSPTIFVVRLMLQRFLTTFQRYSDDFRTFFT